MPNEEAANRLGELMRAAGLKRYDIAALCERDTTTIGRWISGQVPIPDEAKLLLARRFNVTVEFLMGWDSGQLPLEPERAA